MRKNKHFMKRLSVLLFSIILSMNGLMLYAKDAETPIDPNGPSSSEDLQAKTTEETETTEAVEETKTAEQTKTTEETKDPPASAGSTEKSQIKTHDNTSVKTTPSAVRASGSPSPYSDVDNNVAKIVREGQDVYYTSFRTALSKASAGEEIILLKDIPAEVGYYSIDKSITLNLNGHSIDGLKNYSIVINKYSGVDIKVTIKNGSVYNSCNKDYDSMGICMPLYIRSCKEVILDNVRLESRPAIDISDTGLRIQKNATQSSGFVPQVTVTGNNSVIKGRTSGINVISDTKNPVKPELVINGGLIEGGSFGIAGNGESDTTSIIVNAGTVRSLDDDGTAIYHPQDGDLAINGGTIEGKNGIQYCGSGRLSLSGGRIIASAAAINEISPDAGNGPILDGAALSILSRGGEYGAAKSADVSITGGILESLNNTAIREYSTGLQETLINSLQIYEEEKKDLKVIAGNQKSAVVLSSLSGSAAKVVSGGRFSSILPDAYCADYYECQKEKDQENLYKVVPHTYSLTYDYKGGKLPDGKKNPSGYTYFDSSFTLVNPQKEGYDFIGWTGNGISTPQKEVIIPSNSQGDKTYTAVYSPKEAKIVFKTNTEDLTIPDKIGKTDEPISDRSMPKVSDRKGYGFAGWFDQKGNKVMMLPEKFPAGTTVYTAKWNFVPLASDPDIQVEIPELAADGTGVSVSDQTITESALLAKDIMEEIAAGKVPKGMSAEDAKKIKSLIDSAGESDSIITVLSLQAERKDQASSADQRGFDSVMREDEQAAAYFNISIALSIRVESPDGTVRQVENVPLSKLESPLLFKLHVDPALIREKAVRIAHVHNKNTEILKTESINRKNGSIELYAQSFSTYAVLTSENVEITFDSRGGSYVSPQKVRYGRTAARPKNPVKKGYTFSGWYSDKECKKIYNFDTKVQDSFTLYAKWTKRKATNIQKENPSKTDAGRQVKTAGTGDTADHRGWILLLAAAGVCIVIIGSTRKKF